VKQTILGIQQFSDPGKGHFYTLLVAYIPGLTGNNGKGPSVMRMAEEFAQRLR